MMMMIMMLLMMMMMIIMMYVNDAVGEVGVDDNAPIKQ